jgi:AhpD family alkylhydroperoxidase
MAAMRALEHYLNSACGLERGLLDLVRLLASHWNGCAYCVALHAHELAERNEAEGRIEGVARWREVPERYTQRELAAFAWTEAVTNIQDGHASDEVYAATMEHFTVDEIVNLTLGITSINSWNRMAIAFRAERKTAGAAPGASTLDPGDGGKVEVED